MPHAATVLLGLMLGAGGLRAGERPLHGRAAVETKLNNIRIESYEVPSPTPVKEVIRDLHRLARDRTIDRSGVNFIIGSALQDYEITLSPALKHLTLRALLGAVTEVAVPPKGREGAPGLRFSIEDYAVVITQRPPEIEPLFTRTFKVDPNTFMQGLDILTQTNRASTILPRSDPTTVQLQVREFFARAGVNFGPIPPPQVPPGAPAPSQKAIFFNDRTGVLYVRATRAELDLIGRALEGK